MWRYRWSWGDLERQTGKVDGHAEGQKGREKDSQRLVAAVLSRAVTQVGTLPHAIVAAQRLRFADHVTPLDLIIISYSMIIEKKIEINNNTIFEI